MNKLNNLYAIKNMTIEEMAVFLDYVYLTGYNNGMYAARAEKEIEDNYSNLDECPYNEEWLSAEAEEATEKVFSDDGDSFVPDHFAKTILKNAGIDENCVDT